MSRLILSKLRPLVTVIIPAYNEKRTIREVVKTVKKVKEVDEIVVVDDGSTDGTSKEIRDLGIKIIRHKRNMGKGAAMKTGLKHAKGEVILFIDADLENIASSKVRSLIKPVLDGKADFSKSKLQTKRGRLTKLLVVP